LDDGGGRFPQHESWVACSPQSLPIAPNVLPRCYSPQLGFDELSTSTSPPSECHESRGCSRPLSVTVAPTSPPWPLLLAPLRFSATLLSHHFVWPASKFVCGSLRDALIEFRRANAALLFASTIVACCSPNNACLAAMPRKNCLGIPREVLLDENPARDPDFTLNPRGSTRVENSSFPM